MAGRFYRIVEACGAVIRDTGAAMRGVFPPLRSSDGTFGTQLAQARERAAERRDTYPG